MKRHDRHPQHPFHLRDHIAQLQTCATATAYITNNETSVIEQSRTQTAHRGGVCPEWINDMDGATMRFAVVLSCLTFWVGLGYIAFGL